MKIYYFTILLILSTSILQAQDSSGKEIYYRDLGGIHVHCNSTQNQAGLSQTSKQEASQTAVQKTQVTQITEITTKLIQTFHDWHQRKKEESSKYVASSIASIKNQKAKIACSATIACYCALWYQIHTTNAIVNHQQSWSNWKKHLSMEELLTSPQQTISSELVHAIQSLYIDPENPADFIFPLIQFSLNIEKEIEALKKQLKIYSWIQRLYCSKLFFINPSDLQDIEAKLTKLFFLQYIFATWTADYKIKQSDAL